MREKSTDRPPRGALMWPSSEVPAPNGMIGTRCVRATRTTSLTSSWFSTQITASGGWLGIQVMVLACWRRISRSGLQPVSEALAQHGNRRGDTVCAATASCLRRHFHPCPSLECR